MKIYETQAGIVPNEKEQKLITDFSKLMKRWGKDGRNLCINAIAGQLTIMYLGDTKSNPEPEMSNTGGFNHDNIIATFLDVNSDGGDW